MRLAAVGLMIAAHLSGDIPPAVASRPRRVRRRNAAAPHAAAHAGRRQGPAPSVADSYHLTIIGRIRIKCACPRRIWRRPVHRRLAAHAATDDPTQGVEPIASVRNQACRDARLSQVRGQRLRDWLGSDRSVLQDTDIAAEGPWDVLGPPPCQRPHGLGGHRLQRSVGPILGQPTKRGCIAAGESGQTPCDGSRDWRLTNRGICLIRIVARSRRVGKHLNCLSGASPAIPVVSAIPGSGAICLRISMCSTLQRSDRYNSVVPEPARSIRACLRGGWSANSSDQTEPSTGKQTHEEVSNETSASGYGRHGRGTVLCSFPGAGGYVLP